MNQITISAYGKINLTLDITGKRHDGYHLLETIMQSVDIFDTVKLKKSDSYNITIKCEGGHAPSDSSNIAFKAARIMQDKYIKVSAVEIEIIKKIPVAAGMAGGSADAAAVIFGINSLFELGLTEKELQEIGLELGADVPFCIKGGTALAKGIGEELSYLNPVQLDMIIVKPEDSVSTDRIYKNVDIAKITNRPDNNTAINAIGSNDKNMLLSSMSNVLEPITKKIVTEVSNIEKTLIDNGAVFAMMTGSGPAVFGIFDDDKKRANAFKELKKTYENTFLAKTVTGGLTVEKWN